jgi:hypothetical protein
MSRTYRLRVTTWHKRKSLEAMRAAQRARWLDFAIQRGDFR